MLFGIIIIIIIIIILFWAFSQISYSSVKFCSYETDRK